ncbi:MAG: hypothetical protein HFG78_09030 [Hungatella sp.]|nr:hypothetical protein [Hungatella sp.]
MEEIIRSKFLRVTPSKEEGKRAAFLGCLPTTWQVTRNGACRDQKEEESFLVIHERNQTVIEAAPEVIDFIDQYITPCALASEDSDEQELCRLLTKIHFLHNNAYAESESYDILNSWLREFEKETRSLRYQDVTAIYAARAGEPVQEILIEILKIGQELYKELIPFWQPLYILFLTPEEYKKLRLEFNVPSDISAFIDSRTLLIMDYQSYFKQNNTRSFYPTVRHELIHILFGQRAYYLPFWVEEGLCEYYSKKYRIDYLNYEIKRQRRISFAEIDSEKVNYISQLNQFKKIQYVFYKQAASFVDFLFQIFSEEYIWDMIGRSSIRRDFFEVLKAEQGIGLIQLQSRWESFIEEYS